MKAISWFLAAAMASASLACDDDDDAVEIRNELTDSQVVGVMQAANEGEVSQAQAATPKLVTEGARMYAMKMVVEHEAASEQLSMLLEDQNLESSDSSISTDLEQRSQQLLQQMAATAGPVDDLYIDGQVDMHQRVLQVIDTRLLPTVDNAELRGYLQSTRPKILEHLQEAQALGGGDGGTGGTGGTGGSGGAAGSGTGGGPTR